MTNIRPGHIVKWFPDRGYGFIGGPDGKISVHAAEIEKSNLDLPPKIGQPVWFMIVESREGIRATSLSRREDAVTRDAKEKRLSQERQRQSRATEIAGVLSSHLGYILSVKNIVKIIAANPEIDAATTNDEMIRMIIALQSQGNGNE
jgi:cold shock CspA family protein